MNDHIFVFSIVVDTSIHICLLIQWKALDLN